MFRKSIIISLSIFFVLMIFTSIIKNNTRNIEKNIGKLGLEVSILEKEFADAKTDFIYLSTPQKLLKELKNLSQDKYQSYDFSRIFLSTDDFIKKTSQQAKNFKKNN